jgi:hypothetical protein
MVDQSGNAVCSVCGAAFANEDLLRDHSDMHGNRCPTCGSEFTTEALLSDHQRMHGATTAAEDANLLEQQGERKP